MSAACPQNSPKKILAGGFPWEVEPANVMVGRYGEVVLMDWGLAKVSTQGPPAASSPFASQEGVVVGTVPDLVSSHRQSLK